MKKVLKILQRDEPPPRDGEDSQSSPTPVLPPATVATPQFATVGIIPISALPLPPQDPSLQSRSTRIRPLSIGKFGRAIELSVQWQNLLNDEFISNAPRVEIEGKQVPALGGIPLLAKLGQGGMGAVYYGVHRGFEREVAVKILPFHLAEFRPDLVRRFFREARIAAEVNSPHLVRVTDVAQEGKLSYLVMEFISGKSAAAMLKTRKSFNERAALEICIAAAKGLAAAHAANIVHRDLKPDNIMVPKRADSKDEYDFAAAKLADLGLARNDDAVHSMTNAESCLGTPGYMAPEQIADSRKGGKPADVFGLGATLYALLWGESPFAAENSMKTMWATIDAPHQPIRTHRNVSKATAELIDICLAKDPAHRYADGAALLKALETAYKALTDPQSVNFVEITQPRIARAAEEKKKLEEQALNAPLPGIPPPARTPRTTLLGLAVLAAVVLGALAYFGDAYWHHPRKQDALAELKTLDESQRDFDSRMSDEDSVRKEAADEFAKNQARLNAKVIAEFDTLLEQIKKAKSGGDGALFAKLIDKARAHPGYVHNISPRRAELDALQNALNAAMHNP